MKRTLALILALIFVLFAASCRHGGAPDSVTTQDPATSDVALGPVSGRIFWDELKSAREELYISFAQPFRDGAAWIFVSSRDGSEGRMMLIGTDGTALYKGPGQTGDYTPGNVTNFCRGVSLYEDNGARYLIAKDGRVIWCDAEDGVKEAERLFGAGSCGSVSLYSYVNAGSDYFCTDHELIKGSYFNGYSVVVMTMKDGAERYGILSPEGKWMLAPTDMYAYSFEFNSDSAFTAFRYDRDGDFLALNLETGTMTDLGRKGENASSVIYPHESELTRAAQRGFELEKGGGLLYSREKKGFVNDKDEVVIDLSSYTLAEKKRDGDEYIPYFYGGKCVLTFVVDGAPYFTVIDKEGNRLFDPVPFPSSDLTDAENNRYAYINGGVFTFSKEPDPTYYMYGAGKYGVYYG
ncbi:MAG: hypothetical protein J5879_07990, partial [Clostridia bacterium]|nr:hypothetical protein [Clostridia bacterium]